MGEYLTLIVSISLFSALINVFLGEKGVSKTSRFVVSTVILLVVTIPIIKSLVAINNNIAFPVIKEEYSHNIDNKEDGELHKAWLAKVTAEEVSKEIREAVKTYTGFETRIECPWRIEEGNVVFDIIRVYTNADERYHEKIRNTIKLHYALDSVCIKE